ncbi:GAF domain-containing protein [Magnetospirillum gryphiswaldense]|uniref:GAF domain-containing protein n=1 Tax=Magnetospirillum gryphiswaldense TaxID=55518 RepID=A4TUM1_9PROT|nr:GAF domain-containing protein [Magnetospirillum gryphiswaldense]AVM74852.1 membrane-bound lytic transglycosylase F [Magnetospirillum gryphiswaldense MSR-1]AVM78755.1 membrane-bound lytic transglycosylase F [Magnetospirillum gryphiswaldense]CAM74328.1 conserved hypothetical protein, secreted [Magnetospirillum gryphiswaldense MSR-1]
MPQPFRLTLLTIAALALAWPGESRELSVIRQSGELRICLAGTSAGFYQANAESFARFLGVRPAVTTLADWDQQFHDHEGRTVAEATYVTRFLADGSCDVFPNDLHMVAWRRSKMELVPYYLTRKMVVAHRDLRGDLHQPSDLGGRIAAVQKGTSYEGWLRKLNETILAANPVRIETYPTAESMKRVAGRHAEFTVIGAEAGFKWVRGDLDNLDLLFPVDDVVEVGWGIHPAATELRDSLRGFFAENKRVGSEMDRAWQKQYGISLMEYQLFSASLAEDGLDIQAILTWAAPIGAGAAGLLIAMAIWTRRLNREIAHHKRTAAALQEAQAILAQESAQRLSISHLTVNLQQVRDIHEFGSVLLSHLARELSLGMGVVCVKDPTSDQLVPVAQYAGTGGAATAFGEAEAHLGSLVERCTATGEIIVVDAPERRHFRIRSGLGNCSPASIVLYPVKHKGQLVALLELAALKTIDDAGMTFLRELEPIIGFAVRGVHFAEDSIC